MFKKIATLLLIALWTCSAFADQPKHKPLRDGAVLAGADGTLVKDPNADRWLFILKTTVADDRGAINEGEAIEVLRSSTLEKMLSIATPEKSIFVSGGMWHNLRAKILFFLFIFLPLLNSGRETPMPPPHKSP
jgi:hypothetical protein